MLAEALSVSGDEAGVMSAVTVSSKEVFNTANSPAPEAIGRAARSLARKSVILRWFGRVPGIQSQSRMAFRNWAWQRCLAELTGRTTAGEGSLAGVGAP
jgi:hypothetical protein